jgi:stress-induced-phosphoprotein 1
MAREIFVRIHVVCFSSADSLVGANDAFEEALKLDPNNAQAKSGLESVKRAMEREAGAGFGGAEDPMGGLTKIFTDPGVPQKLGANPKTSHLLADTEFMMKLQRIRQNPQLLNQELMSDPRFFTVMGVLMGVDISATERPATDEPGIGGSNVREVDEDIPMPDAKSSASKQPEPEPVSDEEDEEEKAKKEAKVKADEEKRLGTESYKKRQFDAAIQHYSNAWELHKDITYLTNLGAAYFEKGDYEKCIETCNKAITEGREMLADFKLIAKYVPQIFLTLANNSGHSEE